MGKVGVVFVSWNIPEHRLQAHFRWNAELYGETGASVFVVTDREYDLPRYARCVVFPEGRFPVARGRRIFATTRCRNAGVQAAIAAGCSPIICTDVDICFECEAWEAMLAVACDVAVIPYCRMSYSSDWERREEKWLEAPLATGTVSMPAENWGKVSYCEEQVGYGGDDGLMEQRIKKVGLDIVRAGLIYHMAHKDGADQAEFHGRVDHWNRASGFNPANFANNGRQQ